MSYPETYMYTSLYQLSGNVKDQNKLVISVEEFRALLDSDRAAQPTCDTTSEQFRQTVREVFMAHGFTIKEGQADLKSYVFDAAEALVTRLRPAPLQESAQPVADSDLEKLATDLELYSDYEKGRSQADFLDPVLFGRAAIALYTAAQPAEVQPVAYALKWPQDSCINLSAVFDTLAEAVGYAEGCTTRGITVVPLTAAALPAGSKLLNLTTTQAKGN